MNTIMIPVTKTVTTTVPNGHVEIIDTGTSFQIKYHNEIYKGSPFLCSVSFSKDYSVEQIMRSSEVIRFLRRFE